jgi:hypothetical protein
MTTATPPRSTAKRKRAEEDPRLIVRAWLEKEIAPRGSWETHKVIASFRRRYGKDREFLAALAAVAIPALVTEELRRMSTRSRSVGAPKAVATAAGAVEEVDITAGPTRSRFARWMEHAGGMRHVSLLNMTRADLLSAAADRQMRGMGEMRRAKFLTVLAGQLDGDQMVGDRFTERELAAIHTNVIENQENA